MSNGPGSHDANVGAFSQNPYEASSLPAETVFDGESSAEAIRRVYLKHEAAVKSIGTLYLLGAVLLLLVLVGLIASTVASFQQPSSMSGMGVGVIVPLFFVALTGLQLFVGLGLRKLSSASRVGATFTSVLGLIGFPVGTLISLYVLYLLWSEKGRFVFTDEYRKIVQETPHIKYKSSVWVILLLVILVLVLLAILLPLFMA